MIERLTGREAPPGLPEDSEIGSPVLLPSLFYGKPDSENQSAADQYDGPGWPTTSPYACLVRCPVCTRGSQVITSYHSLHHQLT